MAWQYTPIESGWLVGYNVTVLDYQHIESDLHTWGGNVNAGGNSLTNVATVIGSGGITMQVSNNSATFISSASKTSTNNPFLVLSSAASDNPNNLEFFAQLVTGATPSFRRTALFCFEGGVGFRAITLNESGQGNVGVGISIPNATLHVKTGTNADSTGQPGTLWSSIIYNATNAPGYNGLLVRNNWAASNSTVFQAGVDLVGGAFNSFFEVRGSGAIAIPALPSTNPGGGSKMLWFDPSDGNRVKFAA